VSGTDLGQFFEQWVYNPGNPSFDITWAQQGGDVQVQVCQQGEIFDLPLDLRLDEQGGSAQAQTMQVDQAQEQATYTGLPVLTGLAADPQQKVLAAISVTQVDALQACPP
jgi:aminopeptidase N